MHPLLPLSGLTLVLALSACSTAPEIPSRSSCQAEKVQDFVGKALDTEKAEQAQEEAHASILRVILPNQPVTLDYSDQRLNIYIDEDEQILKLNCG